MPFALAYDPGRPLISIHIPKCGGTSVAAALAAWFGAGFHAHYLDEATRQLPPRWPLGPGMCVHGHFNARRGFGVRDYYPEADQLVTFLRDPFEMHLSLYFYLKQYRASYRRDGRPYDITTEYPDVAAFIAGIARQPGHWLALSVLDYLPLDAAADPVEQLMSGFLHVGITEDSDASLRLLARKLGKPAPVTEHLNAAVRDEASAHDELRPLHETAFAVEHALYRAALARHREEAGRLEEEQPR